MRRRVLDLVSVPVVIAAYVLAVVAVVVVAGWAILSVLT